MTQTHFVIIYIIILIASSKFILDNLIDWFSYMDSEDAARSIESLLALVIMAILFWPITVPILIIRSYFVMRKNRAIKKVLKDRSSSVSTPVVKGVFRAQR